MLDVVDDVAKRLEEKLLTETRIFESVFAPANQTFFQMNALYYLSEDELDSLVSKLAESQPALAALAQETNLRGLLSLISLQLQALEAQPASNGFIDLIERVAMTAATVGSPQAEPVAWARLFFLPEEEEEKTYYNLIIVKGALDFSDSLPNAKIVSTLRDAIAELDLSESDGVKVRLTGETPLDHEEIVAAQDGAGLAGSLSLFFLVAVLALGVRSFKVILATYMTLLVGLVWTSAYASFAVGAYNTISIVFLVMFIGLSVDFAIHFCLRYQEALRNADPQQHPLAEAASSAGGALALCMVTSSLGFLSFWPTDYTGLGELGIISAGGMVIALILCFTFIPAFFALFGAPKALPVVREGQEPLVAKLFARDKLVTLLVVLLGGAAVVVALRMPFDFSTLALKNPESEAMATLRELQENDAVTDYSISVIVPNDEALPDLVERLRALPTVAEVRTPASNLPRSGIQALGTCARSKTMESGLIREFDFDGDRFSFDLCCKRQEALGNFTTCNA